MQQMTVNVLMVDGTEHANVPVILADQVGFSSARQRHKWPTMQDDPVLAGGFMAFLAMKRLGLFTDSWDQFTASVASVSSDDDGEDDGLDPTRTAI